MVKNERLLIYPYNIQFSPILRHKDLLKGYEISCLVSPNGWGYTGKDAGIADNGPDIGMTVSSDFEDSLGLCDTVVFIDSYFPLDFKKNIYNKIKMAIKSKKNIICFLQLETNIITELECICRYEGVYFKYYGRSQDVLADNIYIENENIEEINTPIVFVIGLAERTNKFEIQLALREKIHELGYKISQVGTRTYCDMMGFHSFPSFMLESNISEVNKILMFNRFIKKIEDTENPDIIIIGVPGGIMPYNSTYTNKFGILAFEVSQAVLPDFVIFSMFYEDYKVDGFEFYNNSLKYKLGFNIDIFNIANAQFDWVRAYEEKRISHISLDYKAISEKNKGYSQSNIPVLNILDENDSDKIAKLLIEKLSKYGDVEIV
ncbi:TIGR04066 family peptide maturation system protein [Ruminiclostridium herbifermentans]|uniref:TIGR04066 family peptide maturation system protein n=1 Tax=Ruminiclostridium herbifermentans TaxID=2488810 RepID=A0A4U7JGV1_9FIRM|nr:TIGR04066 family peptide maturation system protein [Ruminiclostridium herbifermentans]QNU67327.1 TIGR04066 family peptide maturation system protein [Ruminiclostridium herbifermentans]